MTNTATAYERSYREMMRPAPRAPSPSDLTKTLSNAVSVGKLTRTELKNMQESFEKEARQQERTTVALGWAKKASELGYEAGKMTVFSPVVLGVGYLSGAQEKVTKTEIAFQAASVLPIVGFVKGAKPMFSAAAAVTMKVEGAEVMTDSLYLTETLKEKTLLQVPFAEFRGRFSAMLTRLDQVSETWSKIYKSEIARGLSIDKFNKESEYVLKSGGDTVKFAKNYAADLEDEMATVYSRFRFVAETPREQSLQFILGDSAISDGLKTGRLTRAVRHIAESDSIAVQRIPGGSQAIIEMRKGTEDTMTFVANRIKVEGKRVYEIVEHQK